jgi:hypothetical protein
MMNEATLIAERLPICEACEFLNQKTKCCKRVARKDHPTLLGYIYHANGIKNPKARCPEGKWDYYPSNHSKEMEVIIPLTDILRREITIKGFTKNNELTFTTKLFNRSEFLGLGIKRSEILSKIREIRLKPNKV